MSLTIVEIEINNSSPRFVRALYPTSLRTGRDSSEPDPVSFHSVEGGSEETAPANDQAIAT
jgi:hypothetical protein